MTVDGHVVGALDLLAPEADAYDSSDEAFAGALAGLLAILVERGDLLSARLADQRRLEEARTFRETYEARLAAEVARQTAELRRTEQTQKILLEIAKAMHSTLDLKHVFHTLVNSLRPVMAFERASILMISEDHRVLRFRELEPPEREFLGRDSVIPLEGSAAGRAIREARPLVTPDLETGSVYYEDSFLRRAGIRSRAIIPLFVQQRPIGTLNLACNSPNRFSSEDIDFLAQLAEQISCAVANSEAYREIEKLKNRLQAENVQLREVMVRSPLLSDLVGESAPWRRVLQQVDMVAPTDATVLIRGETGTGKELIARAIHRLSPRANKPFVAINCAALTPELIASELFGHERGSFTGALQRKLGRLELADGGTFFLDEVAELPADMQVKLLRVLQEREFERVGGTQTIKVDVRLVTATNRNLEVEREEGRFRDDLYFRLNVFPILVPPLRERVEDIEPLLHYFLRRCAQKLRRAFDHVDAATLERCRRYPWPGNVRELENLVERSVILCPGPAFQLDPQPDGFSHSGGVGSVPTLQDSVRDHLVRALRKTRGKIYGRDGAAELLGLKPPTLQAKMKKYGLDRRDYLRG